MNKYILWKSMNKSEKNEEEELEAPLRKKSISSLKKKKQKKKQAWIITVKVTSDNFASLSTIY